MRFRGLAGLLLVALGAAALAWPEFSCTTARHEAKLGPLEFTVKEQETHRVPVWAGLALVAAGAALVWRRKA
jgi:LPXTG-motif cell wall-anchored protein